MKILLEHRKPAIPGQINYFVYIIFGLNDEYQFLLKSFQNKFVAVQFACDLTGLLECEMEETK